VLIFKSVTWKNFLSTGNASNTVKLNEHKSTLVIGKNGEGKSTMLDALTFVLFGKPFRDINKNQLINSINKKNCLVEVEFEVNNSSYKVSRGIKPNIFTIECNGVVINQDAALKDYQKVLEQQIIRLNYKTFTQVIILGSSSFVPFMQLPSNQRREVIEDILDIRVFSSMNSILKEKMLAVKESLLKIESLVSAEKTKIESQKMLIAALVNSKSEAIDSLVIKVSENVKNIEVSKQNIERINKEIATLREKLTSSAELQTNLEKAKSLKAKTSHKVESFESELQFFEENTTCPSCAQNIDTEHKSHCTTDLNKSIKENSEKLEEIDKIIRKFMEQADAMSAINSSIIEKNIEVSAHNNSITIYNEQTSKLNAEIEQTKLNTGDIDAEKKTLKSFAEKAIELINNKNVLLEQRNLQEVASMLLKDTGIKTAIIKEYLPAMNKLINKYLTSMDFFVKFELDESFNEIIKSRHRDEFTYASFSEGEKQKIDLAILFTWRQIAKMKNSVNTNLLIMDEVFDSSLDSNSTDYLLHLLEELSKETNVFVISHKGDQLLDKFQTTIKFEKKNDFSVVASQ
jgi:DNA repair exonuclease SbcCD ATPase subunit